MSLIFQIFLLGFLLSFAYLSRKDIQKGVYALVFFMPLYLVRFTVGGIPTTALEIMICILFALWLFKSRKGMNIRKRLSEFFREEKFLAGGIILLFLGAMLSTIFSSDLRASLGVLKGWFLDPLLFFVVYANVIRGEKEIRASLLSLVLSAFGVALVALGYAAAGVSTYDGRLRAFYESPNYLAMYLAPAFLLAISLFGVGKAARGNDRKMQLAILSALLIVLLLTRSYGAVLAAVVAFAFLAMRRYPDEEIIFSFRNKKASLALAILVLGIFSYVSYQKYEQVVTAGERSSLASRVMIWNASREMLKDSPVFGIGPGAFQKTYLEYQSRFAVPYLEWAVPQPHNTFLAFYLESGLAGLIGFILILVWFFKRARTDDLVFLFLIYFLVHGLIDTLYWKNDLALIFWLVLGAAYAGKKKQPRSSEIPTDETV